MAGKYTTLNKGLIVKMRKVNFGCGEEYKEGWINLDYRDNIKKDIKHDLNKFPYPFKNNEIDVAYIKNTIAFLEDPIKVIKELARVTKKGGQIIISTPHAISYSYLSGLGHTHHFTENTFRDYTMKEYEIENILKFEGYKFTYTNKWKKFIPLKKYLKIFLRGLYDDIEFKFSVIK